MEGIIQCLDGLQFSFFFLNPILQLHTCKKYSMNWAYKLKELLVTIVITGINLKKSVKYTSKNLYAKYLLSNPVLSHLVIYHFSILIHYAYSVIICYFDYTLEFQLYYSLNLNQYKTYRY